MRCDRLAAAMSRSAGDEVEGTVAVSYGASIDPLMIARLPSALINGPMVSAYFLAFCQPLNICDAKPYWSARR